MAALAYCLQFKGNPYHLNLYFGGFHVIHQHKDISDKLVRS